MRQIKGNLFVFNPGERAIIKRDRLSKSYKTPLWADLCECEIVKYNSHSVSIKIKGHEKEKNYADAKDLVPIGYDALNRYKTIF